MNYGLLLLTLVLLVQAHGIQTRDEIADKTNTTDDGLSLPPDRTENGRDTKEHVRALQQSGRGQDFTAGNTMCRNNHRCGYHDKTSYSWCYTDYSDHWDYCCTGECNFHGQIYQWCKSGKILWQHCGQAGTRDIQGRPCLLTHPCGLHRDEEKDNFYWCYVDLNKNWDRCCSPWEICGKHEEAWFNWCYTGITKYTNFQECKPEE